MKLFYAVAALFIGVSPAFAGGTCLQRHDIDGWGARDAHSLVVNDRFGKKYLLTVSGWCQDLDFSLGISIRGHGGGEFSCLERGDDVVAHGGGAMHSPGTRCMITKIEAYTPEMEKAYRQAKDAAKADKAAPADRKTDDHQ